MAEDGRSRLGRGLAALIGDVGDETKVVERARGARKAPIEFVKANPRNPRRNFADEELDELAASIKERGIIQPIVVRAHQGHDRPVRDRRRRAALARGAARRPARGADRHRRGDRRRGAELAIIENVQRADLNPLEEAMGYQSLIDEYNHSQNDVAKFVGKSRSHVANTLRLLQLLGLGEGLDPYRPAHRRPCARAGRSAECRRARARHRQARAQRAPGRSADAAARTAERRRGRGRASRAQGRRHHGAGAARLRRARPQRHHRAPGKGGVVHVAYGDLEQMEDVLRRSWSGSRVWRVL